MTQAVAAEAARVVERAAVRRRNPLRCCLLPLLALSLASWSLRRRRSRHCHRTRRSPIRLRGPARRAGHGQAPAVTPFPPAAHRARQFDNRNARVGSPRRNEP
eukprot:1542780-Prymnesium_polylepis.1